MKSMSSMIEVLNWINDLPYKAYTMNNSESVYIYVPLGHSENQIKKNTPQNLLSSFIKAPRCRIGFFQNPKIESRNFHGISTLLRLLHFSEFSASQLSSHHFQKP
jgi:hypothetical protein